MSQGKYSPNLPRKKYEEYVFNCYGKVPAPWKGGDEYDEKTMFGGYDSEGFDQYGYSAFDADGNYAGNGSGVDRNGYTEMEYLVMDPDDFYAVPWAR